MNCVNNEVWTIIHRKEIKLNNQAIHSFSKKKNHYLYLKIKYKYICWGLKNHDTRTKEMAHWANPMESKIKKGLSSQKKRMVGLKDLKPKIHKGVGFKGLWNRGKKENGLACQDQRTKESPVERTRPEIHGTCSAAKVGLRQLKRGTKKLKKRRTDMSFSNTQWYNKEPEGLESNNSWAKGWYFE